MLYRIQMISLCNNIKHQYFGHSRDRQYLFWKLEKKKIESDREA